MSIQSALALTLVLGSTAAVAECVLPDMPGMPDGATANMEQMIAGQKAVKSFQAENIAYMGCLEKAFNEAEPATTKGTDEEKAAASAIYDKALDEYNDAVSMEEKVAGQFNTEIREYKAANPG